MTLSLTMDCINVTLVTKLQVPRQLWWHIGGDSERMKKNSFANDARISDISILVIS